MTAIKATLPPTPTRTHGHVEVLETIAGDIRRGDQVAFGSPEGEAGQEVAGGITAIRRGRDSRTVAVVVDNRVHFLPADHRVIIVRGCQPPLTRQHRQDTDDAALPLSVVEENPHGLRHPVRP